MAQVSTAHGALSCKLTLTSDSDVESYITHLRIYEFGNSPSSPPPPSEALTARKERYIIVAVRTSGKLRIHKARENQNGSFSIGKTWLLDDLTAFRSYTTPIDGTPEENDQRTWAGNLGFTISLGKMYYWQAMFPKEKQFFIASVVKIYNKYTGGSYPQFYGFAERELEQMLGSRAAAQRILAQQQAVPQQLSSQEEPSQTVPQQQISQRASPAPSGPLPNPPYAQAQNKAPGGDPSREVRMRQQQSREPMQRPLNPPSITSTYASQRPPPSREGREPSPGSRPEYGIVGTPQASMRPTAGPNQSQESLSTDTSSLPPRSRSGLSGASNMPGRFPTESATPTSQRAMTPESGYRGSKDTLNEIPTVPVPLAVPPERRRPPMPPGNDSAQRGLNTNESFVPAPLSSPARRRDEQRPTTPNTSAVPDRTRSERVATPETMPVVNELDDVKMANNANGNGTKPGMNQITQSRSNSDNAGAITSEIVDGQEPQPVTTSESPKEAGPGEREPMIKKKLFANKIMAAAKTVNAFQPRAGGAGQRRQNAVTKPSDGPDGITGVVPAPSLLRTTTDDSIKFTLPPKSSTPVPHVIPEVKVTEPVVKTETAVVTPTEALEETATEKPKVREVRRQKPPAELMSKELLGIGIDPMVLGDRGADLLHAWDEFGFAGQGMHSININKMQEQVQHELNKIQTGADYLKLMNEQDDRIEAVHKGFDATLDACEELDALLTLYLVELDVRYHPSSGIVKLTFSDSDARYRLHRGTVAGSSGASSKSKTPAGRA